MVTLCRQLGPPTSGLHSQVETCLGIYWSAIPTASPASSAANSLWRSLFSYGHPSGSTNSHTNTFRCSCYSSDGHLLPTLSSAAVTAQTEVDLPTLPPTLAHSPSHLGSPFHFPADSLRHSLYRSDGHLSGPTNSTANSSFIALTASVAPPTLPPTPSGTSVWAYLTQIAKSAAQQAISQVLAHAPNTLQTRLPTPSVHATHRASILPTPPLSHHSCTNHRPHLHRLWPSYRRPYLHWHQCTAPSNTSNSSPPFAAPPPPPPAISSKFSAAAAAGD